MVLPWIYIYENKNLFYFVNEIFISKIWALHNFLLLLNSYN